MSENEFIYRVDSTDIIVSVSDNWRSFAYGNDWSGLQSPEEVVGHKLWNFIQDPETQHLYQQLFRRAREGKPSRPIPFRCDSPSERRFLELLLKALPDGQIAITSKILRTEPRPPVKLLDTATPRTTDLLTICSMCKKIKISPEEWLEIEDAMAHLRLFEADKVPQLTHGMCHPCYQAAMQELDNFETPKKPSAATEQAAHDRQ